MFEKTTLGLVLISSLGVMGCTAPEKLEGPWIAPSSDPLPKAAVTDTEALAVWHKRPGTSPRIHVARKLSGSPWTGPFDIGEGTRPEVALSPAGNGIVLFRGTGLSAVSVASGTWGPVQRIDGGVGSFDEYSVGVDALGNGVATWSGSSGVVAAGYGLTSGWATPVTLTTTGASWVKVAVNGPGDALAAWCQGSTLTAARRAAGTTVWSLATLGADCCDPSGLANWNPVRVTIADGGDGMVIGAGDRVCARRFSASSSSWGPLSQLWSTSSFMPAIAMNASGQAFAAWVHTTSLFARAFDPAAGWGPALSGPTGLRADGVGVGIDATGNGAAVTTLRDPVGIGASVHYVTYNATTHTLSAPVSVESLPGSSYYLDVASTPTGKGLTIWNQNSGTGSEIWVSRFAL